MGKHAQGKLIYSVIGSLDGFINDAEGNYDWAFPGDDLVAFLNDQMANVSTYLYGRRMYEEMQVWETDPDLAAGDPESAQFASIWRAADKIVYSKTLTAVSTERTRVEREFDPDQVRKIKHAASGDLTVEGPTLAAHALRAGLVDEIHRFVAPAVVGGGTPLYPEGLRLGLELLDERRFDKGIAYLRYRIRSRKSKTQRSAAIFR